MVGNVRILNILFTYSDLRLVVSGDSVYLHFSRVAGADTLAGALPVWGVETAAVGTLE